MRSICSARRVPVSQFLTAAGLPILDSNHSGVAPLHPHQASGGIVPCRRRASAHGGTPPQTHQAPGSRGTAHGALGLGVAAPGLAVLAPTVKGIAGAETRFDAEGSPARSGSYPPVKILLRSAITAPNAVRRQQQVRRGSHRRAAL